MAQLAVNLAAIVLAGVVTLFIQRKLYQRRRQHLDDLRGGAGLADQAREGGRPPLIGQLAVPRHSPARPRGGARRGSFGIALTSASRFGACLGDC